VWGSSLQDVLLQPLSKLPRVHLQTLLKASVIICAYKKSCDSRSDQRWSSPGPCPWQWWIHREKQMKRARTYWYFLGNTFLSFCGSGSSWSRVEKQYFCYKNNWVGCTHLYCSGNNTHTMGQQIKQQKQFDSLLPNSSSLGPNMFLLRIGSFKPI